MAQQDRPTLKTIATIAGLAVTTVSRALAGAPQIAPETRARVQRIADEIGYSPDRAAQRLRTGRSNVIALILPPHEEILGYGASMIRGITRALRGTPYHVVVMPHFEDIPEEQTLDKIIRNRLADGILFSCIRPDDRRVKILLEDKLPFVTHGRTELATPHPWVDYDNFAFAYRAVERLVALGVRRPALVSAPPAQTFSQHLRAGFFRACGEAGVAGEVMDGIDTDDPPEAIYRHIRARLDHAGMPDGFVCPGEVSALAVNAAWVDAGVSTRHLVMKSTSDIANFIRPRFDSIFEDLTETGERMTTLLLRYIAGEPAEDLHHLLAPPPMTFPDDGR
ncbi:LacI family DNA-binding transcriptional regulator [Paenirhodobacter populi]|uniref:LacI family DNA-binding transcriptional regulator n=1 Tax=Paenirhodobacter populi TaxID=2306993 RepID=A0A443JTB9_9RHOB|nr:substrate-binding domain-containing protein [Sinirhodobacter populi]RWR23731.1 LacI family DNA-binding transcriptional regulator [Sinirhodobacter populi]